MDEVTAFHRKPSHMLISRLCFLLLRQLWNGMTIKTIKTVELRRRTREILWERWRLRGLGTADAGKQLKRRKGKEKEKYKTFDQPFISHRLSMMHCISSFYADFRWHIQIHIQHDSDTLRYRASVKLSKSVFLWIAVSLSTGCTMLSHLWCQTHLDVMRK